MKSQEFQEIVQEKGRELYRIMPWREDTRPYYILVSELMLQQTQVDRVKPKFLEFIRVFPDEKRLAEAPLGDVLTLWTGLGYNRRAKFLHEAAKKIIQTYGGSMPSTKAELQKLPGVGLGTAGAILAYAFNQPVLFIETNVRTVYFHHFFAMSDLVRDDDILPLLEATIDMEHPREFYWALMDYGSWLKKQGAGHISLSYHYKKQSPLEGSIRQMRGQIIKLLTKRDFTAEQLKEALQADDRFEVALSGLLKDGLLARTGRLLHLTK